MVCTWYVVDSTVDDNSSLLHPLSSHHLCSPCPHYKDISLTHLYTQTKPSFYIFLMISVCETALSNLESGGVFIDPVFLTCLGRSAVIEWQVVTVAWFHSRRSCIGAPTILLRPITTACFPTTDTPAECRNWLREERYNR